MAVNFSKGGENFASAGNDEQVMVWKTNFDKIPYQELVESRQQRATSANSQSRASMPNPNAHPNNSEIHAKLNNNGGGVVLSHRDASPLTIPLNESVANNVEDEDTPIPNNPTAAAIASATAAKNGHSTNSFQVRPGMKKLAITNSAPERPNSSGTGSILKKLTNEPNENRKSLPNISNTLEHIVQQLDILTQVKNSLRISFKDKTQSHKAINFF